MPDTDFESRAPLPPDDNSSPTKLPRRSLVSLIGSVASALALKFRRGIGNKTFSSSDVIQTRRGPIPNYLATGVGVMTSVPGSNLLAKPGIQAASPTSVGIDKTLNLADNKIGLAPLSSRHLLGNPISGAAQPVGIPLSTQFVFNQGTLSLSLQASDISNFQTAIALNPNYPAIGPSFAPATRSPDDQASDTYNLKFLGALLDGGVADRVRIQAAYDHVPTGSIIEVPTGNWPKGWDITSSPSKTIMWRLLGSLDMGEGAAPGSAPVTSIGENCITTAFHSDQFLNISKTIKTTANTDPVINVNLTNNCSTIPRFASNAVIKANIMSSSDSNGSNLGFAHSANTRANDGTDQGLTSNITKTGIAQCWNISTEVNDYGFRTFPVAFQNVGAELDICATGQEYPTNYYNTAAPVGRTFILLEGKRVGGSSVAPFAAPVWHQNAAYKVGDVCRVGNSGAFTISSLVWANGIVTVKTSFPHSLAITNSNGSSTFGNICRIIIDGVSPSGYNGIFSATITGSNTFTYPLASKHATVTALGSFVSGVAYTPWSAKLRVQVGSTVTGTGSSGVPSVYIALTNGITGTDQAVLPSGGRSGADGVTWQWQYAVPSAPRAALYKCVRPGKSGNIVPAWTTIVGTNITDGTAEWQYVGQADLEIGQAICIGAIDNTSFGSLLTGSAPIHGCGIDLSNFTLVNEWSQAIGLAPGQGIDFNRLGDPNGGGARNRNVLSYNSHSSKLQYLRDGTPIFEVDNSGNVTASSSITTPKLSIGGPIVYNATQTIKSGRTVIIDSGVGRVIVTTGEALTITMPKSPENQIHSIQDLEIIFTTDNGNLSWALQPNQQWGTSSRPSSVSAGDSVRFVFLQFANVWLRVFPK